MTMTVTAPPVEVTAQTPVAYKFGLFSLPFAGAPEDQAWQTAGLQWVGQGCNHVGITYDPCTSEDEVPALTPNVICGLNGPFPAFTVYAHSDESTAGPSLEAKFARARQVLAAGEQWGAEWALWQQLLAAAPSGDAAAASAVEAVAMCEQLIANAYGGTGLIHMSRYAATMAAANAMLRVEGGRLYTMLGTPIVAGGGYGDPPVASDPDLTMLVTGPLTMTRSDVLDLGQHVDRVINSVSAVVERSYVIGWDCAVLRVEVPGT